MWQCDITPENLLRESNSFSDWNFTCTLHPQIFSDPYGKSPTIVTDQLTSNLSWSLDSCLSAVWILYTMAHRRQILRKIFVMRLLFSTWLKIKFHHSYLALCRHFFLWFLFSSGHSSFLKLPPYITLIRLCDYMRLFSPFNPTISLRSSSVQNTRNNFVLCLLPVHVRDWMMSIASWDRGLMVQSNGPACL